jgi:chromosome segregation ATPase
VIIAKDFLETKIDLSVHKTRFIMEQLCKNGYCKRKLNEYRELTSKQYDDIDTLEMDIKDRDAFVQTLVKARNDYQSEVALLKKKNGDLIKENNDLLEKVDQLDEDTDTGMNLLRNSHERESKLNKELEVYKVNSNKTDEFMKGMMKENEDLKSKFKFVKDNLEKNLEANQEFQNLSNSKDSQIKGLEMELLACREELIMAKNDITHGTVITTIEDKLKEHANLIEVLNEENILFKINYF